MYLLLNFYLAELQQMDAKPFTISPNEALILFRLLKKPDLKLKEINYTIKVKHTSKTSSFQNVSNRKYYEGYERTISFEIEQ